MESNYPDIKKKIHTVIDGKTYADPMRVLSYTTESLRKIQTKLEKDSIFVGHMSIDKILTAIGYGKRIKRKMPQVGEPRPNRNAQFEYINASAAAFSQTGNPVISVDTKKKGNFKNNGSEYRPKKQPRKVLGHDFPIKELEKIATVNKLSLKVSPWGARDCSGNPTGFAWANPRSWSGKPGFWRGSAKNARMFFLSC